MEVGYLVHPRMSAVSSQPFDRIVPPRQANCTVQPEARIPGTLKKGSWVGREGIINPLHPNISMHTLLTILDTFPNVLVRSICLTIKSFFS